MITELNVLFHSSCHLTHLKKQGARLCQASAFFSFFFFSLSTGEITKLHALFRSSSHFTHLKKKTGCKALPSISLFFSFFLSFFFWGGEGAEDVCLYGNRFLMFCESIDGL